MTPPRPGSRSTPGPASGRWGSVRSSDSHDNSGPRLTSRERILKHIEECAQHQRLDISPPEGIPYCREHFIPRLTTPEPPEAMGNGGWVECEWQLHELRPPGEERDEGVYEI